MPHTCSSGSVDLIVSCVDNFEARVAINQACLECDQTWMESGVSENAISGHIQLMIPGATPCYQCFPPVIVAEGLPPVKREGVCAASLPTTMGIVAGLLAQNALKYLLGFGDVTHYLGYDALRDHFPTLPLKANPECTNGCCVARQAEYRAFVKRNAAQAVARHAPVPQPAPEADNEWGIVVDEVFEGELLAVADGCGLEYAFVRAAEPPEEPQVEETVQVSNESVSELAAMLQASLK